MEELRKMGGGGEGAEDGVNGSRPATCLCLVWRGRQSKGFAD